MNEVQKLMEQAGIDYISKNPEPALFSQAHPAWRTGLFAAKTLAFDNYSLRKKAAWDANQAQNVGLAQGKWNVGSVEWVNAGKAAYDYVFEVANANRAHMEVMAKAQEAATLAIYGDRNSKQFNDTLREARRTRVSRTIYEQRIKRAVEVAPSVVASRIALATVLSKAAPFEKREKYIKDYLAVFSPAALEAQHAYDLKIAYELDGKPYSPSTYNSGNVFNSPVASFNSPVASLLAKPPKTPVDKNLIPGKGPKAFTGKPPAGSKGKGKK